MDLCDFFCVPGLNYVNSCSPEGIARGRHGRRQPALMSALAP
jgi:hypothetical protein